MSNITQHINSAKQYGTVRSWDTVDVNGPTTIKVLEQVQAKEPIVQEDEMLTTLTSLLYACSSDELTRAFNAIVQPDDNITLKYIRDGVDRTGEIKVFYK